MSNSVAPIESAVSRRELLARETALVDSSVAGLIGCCAYSRDGEEALVEGICSLQLLNLSLTGDQSLPTQMGAFFDRLFDDTKDEFDRSLLTPLSGPFLVVEVVARASNVDNSRRGVLINTALETMQNQGIVKHPFVTKLSIIRALKKIGSEETELDRFDTSVLARSLEDEWGVLRTKMAIGTTLVAAGLGALVSKLRK